MVNNLTSPVPENKKHLMDFLLICLEKKIYIIVFSLCFIWCENENIKRGERGHFKRT